MHSHAESVQENKNQSKSGELSQQSEVDQSGALMQFVDNRPESVAQLKMQEMANNSSLGNVNKFQPEETAVSNEVAQHVTVARVNSDVDQDWGAANTLVALNAILTAHGIANFTVAEIFKRLRPGGHVGTGNEMYTRADGVVLDQYVQIRVGNLDNGALTAFADAAIAGMGQTFYDNRTGGALMAGDAPAGLSEDGHLVPRENLLGMIRTQLSADIEARAVQNITVTGGNGFSVAAAAANNFITVEGATLTQIVTALSLGVVGHNGAWNRVRTVVGNATYRAELKIGGIVDRRVFAPTGSMVLSVVGDSLH